MVLVFVLFFRSPIDRLCSESKPFLKECFRFRKSKGAPIANFSSIVNLDWCSSQQTSFIDVLIDCSNVFF
jgi:hypothetical protein